MWIIRGEFKLCWSFSGALDLIVLFVRCCCEIVFEEESGIVRGWAVVVVWYIYNFSEWSTSNLLYYFQERKKKNRIKWWKNLFGDGARAPAVRFAHLADVAASPERHETGSADGRPAQRCPAQDLQFMQVYIINSFFFFFFFFLLDYSSVVLRISFRICMLTFVTLLVS